MCVFLIVFVSAVFVNVVLSVEIFTGREMERVIQKFKGGMQYVAASLQKNYLGGFFRVKG